MKTTALFLLLASGALAQGSFSPSIPAKQYQSYANLVLYVDSLGNDGNACTATGTGACLTFNGALSKVPKRVRHAVTITGAVGTFAGFLVSGFVFDSSLQQATAGLTIQGTLQDSTPATGTATGTAASGSAGSGVTFGTLVDTSQTWTVNDLRGKFVVTTGGTGSGQTLVISSNTADTITTVGTWTSPTAGTTYAIRQPGTIINSTVVTAGVGNVANNTASNIFVTNNAAGPAPFNSTTPEILIQQFGFSGSTQRATVNSNLGAVRLSLMRDTVTASTSSFLGVRQSPVVYVTKVFVSSTPSAYVSSTFTTASSAAPNGPGTLSVINSLFQDTTAVASGIVATSGMGTKAVLTSNEMINVRWFSHQSSYSYVYASNNRLRCGSAVSYAFLISPKGTSGSQANSTSADSNQLELAANYIENCDYAVRAEGKAGINIRGALTGSLNSTGFQLSKGAFAVLEIVPTFTTVTTDIELDNITPGNASTVARLRFTELGDNYCFTMSGSLSGACKQTTSSAFTTAVPGPSTLGLMFRLAAMDESAFPTPDGGNFGAMLFGLDASVPYYCNGSQWVPIRFASDGGQ